MQLPVILLWGWLFGKAHNPPHKANFWDQPNWTRIPKLLPSCFNYNDRGESLRREGIKSGNKLRHFPLRGRKGDRLSLLLVRKQRFRPKNTKNLGLPDPTQYLGLSPKSYHFLVTSLRKHSLSTIYLSGWNTPTGCPYRQASGKRI